MIILTPSVVCNREFQRRSENKGDHSGRSFSTVRSVCDQLQQNIRQAEKAPFPPNSSPETSDDADPDSREELRLGSIFRFWSPLAATWLMMAIEGPLLTAVNARLPDQEANLAAYGVAFNIGLFI